MKVSYDTFSKKWLLWKPNYGIISTHETRAEAEAELSRLKNSFAEQDEQGYNSDYHWG